MASPEVRNPTPTPARANFPISGIRADLAGRAIASDGPGYDDARGVFFTGFGRRPAAVVRVADASDVSRAVDLARETGAELAVRSGGGIAQAHHGDASAYRIALDGPTRVRSGAS